MKKIPLCWFAPILLLSVLMTMTMHGQGPGPGPGGPIGRPPVGGPVAAGEADALTIMLRTLNLTNAQKTQIQPIIDAAAPQIRAINAEAAEKTDAVMKSTEAQIKPLLNSYQQQVLASLAKNREAMRVMPFTL